MKKQQKYPAQLEQNNPYHSFLKMCHSNKVATLYVFKG